MEISVYKSTSWKTLPWNQFRRKVFNLQCRIYDSIRKGDVQKTIKLQKCLITSSYSHYIAIRELTEVNTAKKISGIDGKLMLNCKEKVLFANRISEEIKNWKHSPIRKIKIINSIYSRVTQTFFPLPTIEDRIIQFIWKLALEPAHEAIFRESSYGFRVGKTSWDIQKYLKYNLTNLDNYPNKKYLKIDFGNSLTGIKSDSILSKLVFPSKHKFNLYRALKMGLLDGCLVTISYHYSLTNLSFLLLNIAFHGVEDLHKNLQPFSYSNETDSWGIRYGTKLLYSFNEYEDRLISRIDNFLYTLGFNLKLSGVIIFNSVDNFDFLGWCFIVKPSGKVIVYPHNSDWLIYKTEVKFILKNSNYNIEARVKRLSIKTSLWYHYHCFCDLSKVSSLLYSLKNWVNRYLRLHTRASKKERFILLDRGFSSAIIDLY